MTTKVDYKEIENLRKESSVRALNSVRGNMRGVVKQLGKIPLSDIDVELYIDAQRLLERVTKSYNSVYESLPEDYRKYV